MSDLIRRSDAIKAVKEAFDFGDCYCDRYGIIGAIQAIPSAEITADDVLGYCRPRLLAIVAEEALPSADRPQGEWVYIDEPMIGNPYGRYKCSKCNLEEPFESDYCPNCGCRMKGADDE